MSGTSLGNYQLTKSTKIPYAAYIVVADVIGRQIDRQMIDRYTGRVLEVMKISTDKI